MRRILLALILIFISGPAYAAKDRVFTLTVDNDVLTPDDQYFTNGVRVSAAFGEGSQKPWMDRLMDGIFFLPNSFDERVISFSMGQNMYTPEDTGSFALVVNDRPYAGWLYGEMAVEVMRPEKIDTFTVQLGVIGPMSLADRTQRSYHKIIGAGRPNGWPNQLRNEPGLVVAWQRAWLNDIDLGNGWTFSTDPHVALSAGNVYTYAAAGWTFRIGRNFAGENGPPPRISPALPGSRYFKARSKVGWYIFAAVEGRAVARDIFLDGNTFTSSHSVAKKHLVADFQFGIVLLLDGVRVSYTHVFRSKEFTLQPEKHEFSSVNIAFRF